MSRERELLKLLLDNFEQPVAGRFGDVFDEVRELLSTPEPTQDEEPVAWASGVRDLLSWDKLYDDMSPLYFHSKQKTQNEKRMDAILALCGKSAPRPEFVRLSEEEIGEGYRTSSGVEKFFDFYAGVRFAEKQHSITDDQK